MHEHSIRKFISPIPTFGLMYLSASQQRGPLLKGNKPAYIRITKIYNIPTHSIVNLLRWPQQFQRAALQMVTMKVLMKLRQSHHLGCVGVKTSSHIGTGLEGCTQIYLSVVNQLPEKGPGMQRYRLFKWCLIFLQMMVRNQFSY